MVDEDDFIVNEDEDGVEIVDDSVEEVEKPALGDSGWNDYVLGHFSDDEMMENNPTVDGLRRVAQLLLGPIISSKPVSTSLVPTESGTKSVVNYEVQISFDDDGDDIRTFGGVADADRNNSDKPYDRFLSALADTRAEGRALRRALQLKHVVAAEELGSGEKVEKNDDNDPITTSQLNVINSLASRLNINVEAYFKSKGHELSKKLTKSVGTTAVQDISAYQADATTIPADLLTYDSTWRDKLNG